MAKYLRTFQHKRGQLINGENLKLIANSESICDFLRQHNAFPIHPFFNVEIKELTKIIKPISFLSNIVIIRNSPADLAYLSSINSDEQLSRIQSLTGVLN